MWMVLESSARIKASTKASTSSGVARRSLELSKVCSLEAEPQLHRRHRHEKRSSDRIMLRTVCTFKWPLIFALHLNFEFNWAKNLNRAWVDLGLVKWNGEFRENWEGIQILAIQLISKEVNLKRCCLGFYRIKIRFQLEFHISCYSFKK